LEFLSADHFSLIGLYSDNPMQATRIRPRVIDFIKPHFLMGCPACVCYDGHALTGICAAARATIGGIMLENLALERPLAVIDLETTGIDPQKDRIVEIGILKLLPTGGREPFSRRINPGMPIPSGATAIHGISDADVAGALRFEEVADALLALLDGCDCCGFNLKRFDLRVLHAEFARAGRTLSLEGRSLIDAMEIFHRYEPRDLAAAVRFYLGREHNGAHSASDDVQATAQVLGAMLIRYTGLPRTVTGLHQHFIDPGCVDSDGFFARIGGELRFAKGKYRGQPLDHVAATKPDYLEWMLRESLFADTRAIVKDALARARRMGLKSG
jgi:DNA polymerase-3 subunit epsilon